VTSILTQHLRKNLRNGATVGNDNDLAHGISIYVTCVDCVSLSLPNVIVDAGLMKLKAWCAAIGQNVVI